MNSVAEKFEAEMGVARGEGHDGDNVAMAVKHEGLEDTLEIAWAPR